MVTEKSTILNEQGAYSFRVIPGFNKIMIRNEIKRVYGVTPEKINIINTASKKRFLRTKRSGVKPGFKKAVVYLKKGDKIEI